MELITGSPREGRGRANCDRLEHPGRALRPSSSTPSSRQCCGSARPHEEPTDPVMPADPPDARGPLSRSGPVRVATIAVQCWTETVRRLGIPLVVTVPRLGAADAADDCPRDPAMDAHLDAVLSTAEVVFTLTPGAADEIAEQFGRTAIVVAHPSVVLADPGLGAERGLVGLRLGRISAAAPDPAALVRAALSGAVSGGGRLRVLVDAVDEPWIGSAVRKLG